MTRPQRPLLISVMQFEDDLKSGKRTVFDVIEAARRLGADGVELRRETWPAWEEELPAARQRIEDLGLQVTYATHATLFSDDAEGLQTLREDIDAAAALGSPIIRFFPGQLPEADDDASGAVGRELVDYAEDHGVVIALENYARTPGGTLAEIQAVLDRLQTSALMTNIDIGNYWLHNQDTVDAVHAVGDRAVSAHIKDQPADKGAVRPR
ncbi:MAG: sugar phosphate isomerase/epimerase family protein [Caldilineaceae bacterium]